MSKPKVLHITDFAVPNSIPWFYTMLENLTEIDNSLSWWGTTDLNHFRQKYKVLPPSLAAIPDAASLQERIFNKLQSFHWKRTFPAKIKKEGFDIIHAHFAHVGYDCIALKKNTGLPLIVSFYGYDYEAIPFRYPAWKEKYQDLFKAADIFLAEGDFGAAKLISMGCDARKVKVSRLGVKTAHIPFIERKKESGHLKLLQIATFVEKKGHIYTIKAFHQALAKCPDMSLMLVGGGSGGIKKSVTDYVKDNKLESSVQFMDRIDFTKLYEFVADFDVFIHPSCYASDMDCEGGAPIVLLDVQATGMPVISTTHCDIPDEVINGETGLLTTEKDINLLSTSIERFYKMGQVEFDSFAKRAQKHVIDQYDIAATTGKLTGIYKSLL